MAPGLLTAADRVRQATSGPPTSEIGTVTYGSISAFPWTSFIDLDERVPELVWPRSVRTFDQMRHDAQINGLLLGTTLPIRRYRWMLDPNGARPEIVQGLSDDLGLPVKGQEAEHRGRSRGRFSFDAHLAEALLSLVYGHYFFEQAGTIEADGLWHLRKLAPRPPLSISQIELAPDGGLFGIRQLYAGANPLDPFEPIPVDRLVAYPWQKEAAHWVGRSMLRPLFKHYVLKDTLLRVDAINHERAGGVPWAEGPPGADRKQLEDLGAMAQSFRVNETAGMALPNGAKMNMIAPPRGSVTTIDSIKYQDQQMARSFLMMFMELGQTETGSRALGSEFIDFFALSQETIAKWFAGVFCEHVIEDWVDWNYGEQENLVPLLTYEREDDPSVAIGDLVSLIAAGAVQVDSELEDSLRDRFDLPEKGDPRPTPPPAAAAKHRHPGRAAGRDPLEHETHVDFLGLQAAWETQLSTILAHWQGVTSAQVEELHGQIAAASTPHQLAGLSATPGGADELASAMHSLADHGANAAVSEAVAQGRPITAPDMGAAKTRLTARAGATSELLASSLSEAAGRRALSLTGSALTPSDVATQTRDYLTGLSDQYLQDQLGGALTQAQATGRREVFSKSNPTAIYASAILDNNVCVPCAQTDGQYYQSLADAEIDFPSGGNADCEGGPRCRCSLIAVYEAGDVQTVEGG